MDSFNLSLSEEEDEDLQDNLLRIANGTDDSDLDSSNTPTEPLDEMEQGHGSANLNKEPIIISDDSDSEEQEDSSVIATISLKKVRGTVEINRYVSAGTFQMSLANILTIVYLRYFLHFLEWA